MLLSTPLDGSASTALASTQVIGITLDPANVYWTGSNPSLPATRGTIMKMPLGGGTPITLASGQAGPWGIAVDHQSVYWVNTDSASDYWVNNDSSCCPSTTSPTPLAAILRMPIDGGTPTTLASGPGTPAIAVDSESVYWATTNALVKVPVGGGKVTTIAPNQRLSVAIAVDTTSVYWLNRGSNSIEGSVMKATPK
jgi:hypothetical protein